MNDLHIRPSDAVDHSKGRKMIEAIGATEAVTVMLRAEYKLYIYGAASPRLTRI